ncbi:MAG TPA: mechanosensitive ion channel domain-containing protein [Candidatus Sulfotelmatobacter sp.]|nr:mechanosensitive ion channel domain-containing protein [Candidatus Sulfotelmatobacter sp.]
MIVRRLLMPSMLGLALLLAGVGASAQTSSTPPPTTQATTPTGPPVAPPSASPEEISRLVATLNDPTARARLIAELDALLAAQKHAAAPANGAPSDWVTAGLGDVSDGVATLTAEIADLGRIAHAWPKATHWLVTRATDPAARQETFDLLARLAIVLVCAVAAEWLISALIARPRRSVEQWSAHGAATRLLLLTARVVLALVPIAAFVGTAYLSLPLVTSNQATRLLVIAVINANVLARALLAAGRRVLVPEAGEDGATPRPRRLIKLDDDVARDTYHWLRRLGNVAIYGVFLISAAPLIGVPRSVHALLLRVLGLIFTVMIVALITQYREPVRHAIAGDGLPEGRAPNEWRLLRMRLADVWHVLAACYVVGAFLVWALRIPDGFAYLASSTLWTAVTVLLLRAGLVLARRLSVRASRALLDDPAGMPSRAQGYLPLARTALRTILWLLAAVGILQAWGIDVWGWQQSPLGHRVLASAFSIAVILVVAVALWEVASIMIARSLAVGNALDSPRMRAARLRTLLPLLRNVLSVVIVVMTMLIVLSELGIDIAPLLAGAGVVGLAIGFGAQTLVKDVITGLFFLLEDTVNVGDVVDVGGGHSGLVEGISIRSIRLREMDGSVHTVPFSAVPAIKNMTKDFGFAVLDVLVDYRSDLDRAIELLHEIDAAMRADTRLGPMILEPLEMMGVERFADNAVVVRCRVRTVAPRRWEVGREFNRRIKLAFDRSGIGMVAGVPPPEIKDLKPEDAKDETTRAVAH